MLLGFQRATEGHILGGVCAGLASQFDLDRNLVRLAFALLALASGLGIAVYAVLWMLVPTDASDDTPLWSRMRAASRELGPTSTRLFDSASEAWHRSERSDWPRPLSRRWIGIALMTAGAWLALGSLGFFDWLGLGTAVGLGAILIGVALVMSTPESRPSVRRRRF